MSAFSSSLLDIPNGVERWHFVAYDQLNQELLPEAEPESLGLIFIETSWKAKQLPYHKQKLALQLSNQRHFALEMQQLGHPISYVFSEKEYSLILEEIVKEYGEITVTKPAELTLRKSISNLISENKIKILDHKGWLTTSEDFISSVGDSPPWRMDKFYRHLRKSRGIMLDGDGKPVGGSWSLDDQNRLPWDGAVELPSNPEFKPDNITTEVIQMIEEKYSHHPGKIIPSNLPTSITDANRLWKWAKSSVMHWFGPYEDAMTQEHKTLFHTTVSSLLNLNRLMPKTLLDDTLKLEIPLNSKEGFVRQIIGWREFVRHVHELTDGFEIEKEDIPARNGAGWEGEWSKSRITPNVLENNLGLPPTYWGEKSGMLCLDTAVSDVVETGYAHHIPRLMVLANIGNLLGINPRELTDWFWAMFTDAYDWVVEPNVLAMGTYAVGDVMTTKPYVSGTPYIKKMGDYCGDCSLHFKKSCPISDMYWNFLEENQMHFPKNHRMAMPMRSLAKRTQQAKDTAREVTEYVRTQMSQGMELDPEILERIKA
ncbi:cryptochrome/photolyase family protein [Candidatus Poseidoniaceae archaeon]|nr:cryptochrome/photolyase family protein [Candidatus Poseidoniaceae archaeon]